MHELTGSEVAVIGMALRFPGARTPEELWENLKNGVESIRPFSDEELIAAGHDPAHLAHPAYVKARPAIDGIELFDADLFGIPAREARLIDPQHRLFLECCWEALERAGCDSETYPGSIGVYAGSDLNSYLFRLASAPGLVDEVGPFQVEVASDKEYLASRVSYKLDLRGPSLAVQTACSTSLVAIHLACQGLLSGECDMALAGGASVLVPQTSGYFALEGGIHSRDGHCRSFDARAQGTVFGSGVGTVVLKRLTDALADGDAVHAVIKGSAVNNDGSRKIGYTAPGGEGQARVVRAAQIVAEVDPDTITYIEAHGTGTALGDPIEIAALTQAFRATTSRQGFCGIGSVKANFGHLKSAAGVAGLIKTVLCLEHRMLPPLLHLERPNPHIDFAASPFFLVDRLRAWEPAGDTPLRAAVSSFGVGGTNAHVIVEEAPPQEPSGPSRPWQILALSAATATALEQVRGRLARHLRDLRDRLSPADLADVAWTLQTGRRAGRHRAFVVAGPDVTDLADAVAALESPERVQTAAVELRDRPVAFLFPGQGAQHPGMARDVYATEPSFRAHLDRCCEILRPRLGLDLRGVLFPAPGGEEDAARRLEQTALAQPALFAVEHSLALLWMEWGVQPRAMLGHSLGEYVAACLAGVFSLDDALALVAERGRLMQDLPAGAMLSVPLPEEELRSRLGGLALGGLALAAVNGPDRSVVSGEEGAVAGLEAQLAAAGIAVRRLHTSHAFHSPMMEPAAAAFAERVRAVRREAPVLPFLSNLTGTWITAEQATDPAYWARHLRETVRFGDGLRTLAADEKTVLLEVGPGQTLAAFARRSVRQPVASSLPHPKDAAGSAAGHLMGAVGRLWIAGAQIDWRAFHAHERRRRVDLPTYPFERQRYWVDRADGTAGAHAMPSAAVRPAVRRELQDWFQVPAWKPSLPPEEPERAAGRWLLLTPGAGLGATVERRLAASGGSVIAVEPGEAFTEKAPGRFAVRPGDRDDWAALFARLRETGALPESVLHLWGLGEADEDRCFWSLLWLGRELGRLGLPAVQLRVVTDGQAPEKALALGPVRVLPLEHPEIGCAAIDVAVPDSEAARERLADRLIAEAMASATEPVVSWRGEERLVESFEPLRIAAPGRLPFPERGVCLVTGGLGGIGLTLARELARSFRARLVLTGRSVPEGTPAAVRELEELGAEVLVLAADVTDESAMREVVRRTNERFGPVQAAIHAAGVPGGGVIQLKTAAAAARVLAPKVRGTRVLAAALAAEPLELLVLCSSTFAVTGGVGQVDYCAANSFLDAFARQEAQSGLRAVSLDWGAWQEVGMAVKAAAGTAAHRPAQSAPLSERSEPSEPSAPPLHPLLDRRLDPGVYATDFSPARHWLLAEHRILGTPAVPGTTWLEMARAAFARETGAEAVEIRDVTFVSPLLVHEGDSREVRIALEPDNGDGTAFRVTSRAGDGWREHARGSLRRLAGGPPEPRDLAVLAARCTVRELVREGDGLPAAGGAGGGRLVSWGPHWQSLLRADLGDGEALVSLELPGAFASELGELLLHPALLDVATAFGGGVLTGGNALPQSYGRLAVHGPLPQRLLAHVRTQAGLDPDTGTIALDVTLMDDQGGVRVEVEGFTMKRTADRGGEAAPSGRSTAWIRPEEGVEAFRRALSRGRFHQVVISPVDLGANAAAAITAGPHPGAEAGPVPAAGAGAFARPSLATAYVAPSGEAERALAEVWQRVLGFDRIGVQDNFFDLGGDSVVAIQMIAQSTARGLSLTTEQLFEHQTIAALARLVAPPAPAADVSAAALPAESREWLRAHGDDLTASVEDLYGLSPIQEGMLFHSLHGGEEAPYFEQFVFADDQGLDLDRFERAWRQVIERHPVLRTSFVWQDVERPMQLVHRRVELTCERQDWRSLAPAERAERLRGLLAEDRARGLALDRAPLLRLNAIRWDDAGWRIVWSYHHLVLDGWSVEMLLREVAALYAAAGRQTAAALESRRPFHDYIAWLGQQDLAAAETWWRRVFTGFSEPTALGIDRAPGRPVLPGDVHAEIETVLPAALTAALEGFARQHRLTLHTVIAGAWALALSRYSGTEDVVYGSTVSGRPAALPGSESMIGCFINTLPVRVQAAPGQELLAWLQGLQAGQMELRAWEHSPLVEVRRWSGLSGDRPLFEAILVFESFFQAGGSESRRVHQRTNFPLTLVVWPGTEIAFAARFYAGRFAAEDVARLLGYVRELLQAFVQEPVRLADLPLAPAHERAQVLREWNDTAGEIPAVPVHRLVAARAERDPEAPAVADASGRLTYGELEARANRLAHHLIRLGVGPEILVGISLERSAGMVVALLAILKAGGAYLPLDPAYPADRLRLMLDDSGARLLIAENMAEALSSPGLRIIHPDDPAIADESAHPPEVEVERTDLAYVLYTSGSTGRPKGVQVPHGALANFLASMRRQPGLDAADVLLATTSLSFDIAALEIYLPLLAGARLVIARRDEVYDGGRLCELLADHQATAMQGTPSTWRLLIDSGWRGGAGIKVLCGGESLPENLAAELQARAGEVWNLYGPTETTVWSAAERLTPGQPVSIGRPIGNTALYVAGSGCLPAPAGVPGELLIGGAGVARGYLGRPDLTAERFIRDPFAGAGGKPGGRLYRTGDLARHRPDGRLELLGRIDQQVKVRGFRIEPEEIEAVLLRHPDVARAVVVPSGRAGDTYLVACLVPRQMSQVVSRDGGGEASAAESLVSKVRDALAGQLPPYMMPSSWIVLPELPLTPNGKVDRRALLAIRRPDRAAGSRREAPRNALERSVAEIWKELLAVEEIGVDDNFFDIGGHSLLMPRMQGRLRELLGREIGIVHLFRCSTIRALAHHLAGGEEGEAPLAGMERQESRAERGRSRLRQLREERRSLDV